MQTMTIYLLRRYKNPRSLGRIARKGKRKTLSTLEKYPKFFSAFKLLGSTHAQSHKSCFRKFKSDNYVTTMSILHGIIYLISANIPRAQRLVRKMYCVLRIKHISGSARSKQSFLLHQWLIWVGRSRMAKCWLSG